MTDTTLTYFDFEGGRAEPVRIAMHAAGVEFKDDRISFQQFGENRQSYPCRAVPVLYVDGVGFTQSNALSRYFGKQAGLYPDDPWQAFLCDEVLELAEDFMHWLGRSMGKQGEALERARELLVEDRLKPYLQCLDERLAAAGGVFFADGRLTIADLKMLVWIRSLQSGFLDHVPTDLAESVAPALVAHSDRVAAHPVVTAYYQRTETG